MPLIFFYSFLFLFCIIKYTHQFWTNYDFFCWFALLIETQRTFFYIFPLYNPLRRNSYGNVVFGGKRILCTEKGFPNFVKSLVILSEEKRKSWARKSSKKKWWAWNRITKLFYNDDIFISGWLFTHSVLLQLFFCSIFLYFLFFVLLFLFLSFTFFIFCNLFLFLALSLLFSRNFKHKYICTKRKLTKKVLATR